MTATNNRQNVKNDVRNAMIKLIEASLQSQVQSEAINFSISVPLHPGEADNGINLIFGMNRYIVLEVQHGTGENYKMEPFVNPLDPAAAVDRFLVLINM